MQESIPIINIAPFINGDDKDKARLGEEVGLACKHYGFLTISGHGIKQSIIDEAYNAARKFFNLSLEEKMEVHRQGKGRGYIPMEAESLGSTRNTTAPADLKESFNIGPNFEQNLWPKQPVNLKPSWIACFRAMADLAVTMMRIYAVGLNLPECFFDNKIDTPKAILRATHYPPLEKKPLQGQMRVGAHTDYGTLSILNLDPNQGGFQVHDYSVKRWIDVNTTPESLVINIGDLIMRWTNNYWRSTLHRVVNPPASQKLNDRLTMVFLHSPNPGVEVACLEKYCGPGNPARYSPVLAEDYLKMKSAKSRKAVSLDKFG
jgi:isopenicillin N synthase-like dioxygenase